MTVRQPSSVVFIKGVIASSVLLLAACASTGGGTSPSVAVNPMCTILAVVDHHR